MAYLWQSLGQLLVTQSKRGLFPRRENPRPAMAAPEEALSRDALLRAIEALHRTPDRELRRAANSWLEQFQQSLEAWQIADQTLHDPGSSVEARHFCALTLRIKVQRDFEELPPGSSASLRASLLKLLLAHKNGPAPVRTQLCLALAALAAHTPAPEWGEGETGGPGGAGIVGWLQRQLGTQPDAVPALLEVLTVLVQEVGAYKLAVKPERRRQFSGELVTAAPQVFSMLASCHACAPSDANLTNAVLLAFAAWLRFSPGVAASVLLSSPLLGASLQGLRLSETFEAAVEAVLELVRFTVAEGPAGLAANMALVQLLVPSIMELRPRFRAAVKAADALARGEDAEEMEDDEDTVKAMARLFAEMGEAYVDLIASGSAEALMIVEALVEVSRHPEFDIASTTFNFWHLLSSVLTQRPRHKLSSDLAADAVAHMEHDRRLDVFKPTFETLLSLVAVRVRFPGDYDSLRKDERADFRQSRYSVAEVLNDVQQVLGGERAVQLLAEPLVQMARAAQPAQGGQLWDWRAVEASLFCVRALAGPDLVHNQTTLPQVMALLPSLPREPLLLYTVSLTIAAYCEWLGSSPQAASLLPPVLTLLTSALGTPGEAPPAAALALKHVCDACRTQMMSSAEALIQLYLQVIGTPPGPLAAPGVPGSFSLDSEDQLQVVEAVCLVVTTLPPDQCAGAVARLCEPVVSQLEAVVTAAQALPAAPPSASLYTRQLDRIAHIFRHVHQPQAIAVAFQRAWPVFRAIFSQRAADTWVMERLCRACKFAVRNGKGAIASGLGPLLEELKSTFTLHHQSCLLYVASEVIKVFGRDPSCAAYLQGLMNHLFQQTAVHLQTLQAFTDTPDLADDCFLLASRCMRYCGHLLVPTPTFPALLDCALMGMLVQHREACKSILAFLRDSLELVLLGSGQQGQAPRESNDGPSRGAGDSVLAAVDGSSSGTQEAMRSAAQAAVLPRGPLLCQLLLAGLTGVLPESRNDDIMDLLSALLTGCGAMTLQWLQPLLAAIPSHVVSDEEKSRVMQASAVLAEGSQEGAHRPSRASREQFMSAWDDLSGACRRNKRVSQLVQKALLPAFAQQT